MSVRRLGSGNGEVAAESCEISREQALADFRTLLLTRYAEDVQRTMQGGRHKKAAFYIGAKGTELPQVALANFLRKGDYIKGYYRGAPLAVATGTMTVQQLFAQLYGDPDVAHDPASGGRQMNGHMATRILDENGERMDVDGPVWISDVSCTGSQMPAAFGAAYGLDLGHVEGGEYGVSVALIGDGSVMEGPALEAVMQAAAVGVPMVVVVLNNGRSITGSPDQFTPLGSMAKTLQELDRTGEMKIKNSVDGWDYEALNAAFSEVFSDVRLDGVPALIEINVTQPDGHSSSGHPRTLRSEQEVLDQEGNDCVRKMRQWIIDRGLMTEDEVDALEEEVLVEVRAAEEAAWREFYAPIVKLADMVRERCSALGMDIDFSALEKGRDLNCQPGDRLTRQKVVEFVHGLLHQARREEVLVDTVEVLEALKVELKTDLEGRLVGDLYGPEVPIQNVAPRYLDLDGNEIAEADLILSPRSKRNVQVDKAGHVISAGYAVEMAKNDKVVVFGEDVARLGGVQAATKALLGGKEQYIHALRCINPKQSDEWFEAQWEAAVALVKYLPEEGFGPDRIWDMAIAESTIMGTALALAVQGYYPIAEVQYADYLSYAMQQMSDEIATLRYRTAGGQECPMLIRTHGHQLVGINHTGSPMGQLMNACMGFNILVPRDPVRSVALARGAMQTRNPNVLVDTLMQSLAPSAVPDNLDEICIVPGHSEVLKGGRDVTVLTYGQNCHYALDAAGQLEELGIGVEVVDLQSLAPLDTNGVALASIEKTGKVLFLDEDVPNGAMAAVQAELVVRRGAVWHLDDFAFLTAKENRAPYASGQDGRASTKPQVPDIYDALYELVGG